MEKTVTRASSTGGLITEHYVNEVRVWVKHSAGKTYSGKDAETVEEVQPKRRKAK